MTNPSTSQATKARDWPSDTAVLLELGRGSRIENFWTVNDAFQGTQIFGATGSGKSSGSGKAIARAFMESNFGGLVLVAKTDERHAWEELARDTRRSSDLLVFSESNPHRFNFLRYERQRPGKGAGNTENLINLFWSVMEVADRRNARGGEAYWNRALKQLLRNAIDLAVIATGDVDLSSLYRIVTSAPNSLAETSDSAWQRDSVCFALLNAAEQKADKTGRRHDFEMTRQYWLREFAQLAIETRTGIVSMFTSMADCFLRGMLREMFCGAQNFSPEDSFEGRVILLDFPVKEYHELGIFAQILFKYVWQRAVERRIPPSVKRGIAQETIRPVFLWADESQFFVNQYDALFQSTARSSRACTVYLTQNLPGYQAAFTSEGGKPAAEAFLGNLQTKIFHANGDPQTNNWAADSIGRAKQIQASSGVAQGDRQGSSQNAGGAFAIEFIVQPQEFTELRTGGLENRGIVDSIIFQGGRRWLAEEGKGDVPRNFLRHSFNQLST
ncbi:TraM recognition domain-containing protein [Luteolibacter ambystomatis]|uniref:TraM recognition domain-containing protein n=1 Tax=Luteolibacter ambystomatis TaxID=2824561 RepID=A0A975J1F6_9BACT|nr:TraM recognition domain-containing protein [Luteolibacter ambystomatis]QUE52244.1 TraM recognition domain-containing protein [Luteolibacter ambystomatis]